MSRLETQRHAKAAHVSAPSDKSLRPRQNARSRRGADNVDKRFIGPCPAAGPLDSGFTRGRGM